MHQRSSISLSKLLLRNPFRSSLPKYSSSQSLKTLISNPNPSIPPEPTSNLHKFLPFQPSISSSHSQFHQNSRNFSGGSAAEFDKNKVVDEINVKFAEAREEIEAAMESKETVYFNEEAECARDAVKEVLEMFEDLLGKLEEKEREGVRRSMGLKIEQLKAELQQLDD